jgi:two-component system KDP operon response regulator KdpE
MLPRALYPRTLGPAAVQPLVLIVGDDAQHQQGPLVSTLATHGLRSLEVGVRAAALVRAVACGPNLVLVDASVAGVDGVGIAARLRDATSAPILVILGQLDERSGPLVLDAGASDYVVRPFPTGELVARVRIWLRQAARPMTGRAAPDAARPGFRFDRERRLLLVAGREVHITPLESKLVVALLRGGGEALSEEQLVRAVWGPGSPPQPQYLRTLLRQLRQKVEPDAARPRHLISVPGGGYRLRFG